MTDRCHSEIIYEEQAISRSRLPHIDRAARNLPS